MHAMRICVFDSRSSFTHSPLILNRLFIQKHGGRKNKELIGADKMKNNYRFHATSTFFGEEKAGIQLFDVLLFLLCLFSQAKEFIVGVFGVYLLALVFKGTFSSLFLPVCCILYFQTHLLFFLNRFGDIIHMCRALAPYLCFLPLFVSAC